MRTTNKSVAFYQANCVSYIYIYIYLYIYIYYTSLEHPVAMAFMKVFKTNSVTVVNECQEAVGFDTVRRQIIKRKITFLVQMC